MSAAAARDGALRRRPLEEAELSAEGKERMRRIFGADLTPEQAVERIIAEVRSRGDAALRDYSQRIDGLRLGSFEVSAAEIDAAVTALEPRLLEAIELAAARVRAFHEKQKPASWMDWSEGGLGQMVAPLERVGCYVPGGSAVYPSTVLMTAVPARVAGVQEIIVVTPPRHDGIVASVTLAACRVAGVDRVFRLGGAQAIAALAYGTESVPRVDKIVGPGNLFVVLAKRKVFGDVGIDALPGPTETLVIADESANPTFCAADLLAQAEHDPQASPIFITTSQELAEQVRDEVYRQLAVLERRSIAEASINDRGALVVVDSLDEAIDLANYFAPEHLCLLVAEPWACLPKIRNAGGIFLGEGSFEVMGDYIAGPSHVMPTGGTARFSSALSVNDFVKVTSIVAIDEATLEQFAEAAALLARSEGLTAHANAVQVRLDAFKERVRRHGGQS